MLNYNERNFDVYEHDALKDISLIKRRGKTVDPYVVVRGLNMDTGGWESGIYFKDYTSAKAEFVQKTKDKEMAELIAGCYGVDENEHQMKSIRQVLVGYSLKEMFNPEILNKIELVVDLGKIDEKDYTFSSLEEAMEIIEEDFGWTIKTVGQDLELVWITPSKQEHVFYVEQGDSLEETFNNIGLECKEFKGEDLYITWERMKPEEREKFNMPDLSVLKKESQLIENEMKKLGYLVDSCSICEKEKSKELTK